jgi:transformation/transcription domain-associated protein
MLVFSANLVISQQSFLFTGNEAVPFRLTPNLQTFMNPIALEGLFVSSIATIAEALSNPDTDLYDFLAVFIRDELMTWQSVIRKPLGSNITRLRELVNQNVRLCLHRSQKLACRMERDSGEKSEPVFQSVLDLISQATNPLKLAQMDISFLAPL